MITSTSIKNPWTNLPENTPFILPADKPIFDKCGKAVNDVRFDVLPDPYVGSLDSAKVVLLALNPGFRQDDVNINMKDPLFTDQNRANLEHKASPPFYYFHDGLEYCGSNDWWGRILKPLMSAGLHKSELAERIMCIQYFPYHSATYTHLRRVFPSQQYSFELVRQAAKADKTIVIMRSERLWLEAVPELRNTPYIKVSNPRNPVLSIKNLGEESFHQLVRTLKGEG